MFTPLGGNCVRAGLLMSKQVTGRKSFQGRDIQNSSPANTYGRHQLIRLLVIKCLCNCPKPHATMKNEVSGNLAPILNSWQGEMAKKREGVEERAEPVCIKNGTKHLSSKKRKQLKVKFQHPVFLIKFGLFQRHFLSCHKLFQKGLSMMLKKRFEVPNH